MLKVQTATAKQPAIPETGRKETTQYYIIIGEGESKVIINTGEKNYLATKKLIEESIKKTKS